MHEFLLFILRLFDIAVLEMFPLTILDYKRNEHMPFASDARSTKDGSSVVDVLDAARTNLIVVARITEPGRIELLLVILVSGGVVDGDHGAVRDKKFSVAAVVVSCDLALGVVVLGLCNRDCIVVAWDNDEDLSRARLCSIPLCKASAVMAIVVQLYTKERSLHGSMSSNYKSQMSHTESGWPILTSFEAARF